ncbi:hypothetical protein [Clostridium yunnanense]|nr:hypothetical protein [Clostridium yunnanense]
MHNEIVCGNIEDIKRIVESKINEIIQWGTKLPKESNIEMLILM